MKIVRLMGIMVMGTFLFIASLEGAMSRRISIHNGGAAVLQSGDTLLFENFDGVSAGELPEGWDTVDLTNLPQPAYWHIDTLEAYDGQHSWWCGTWFGGIPGYGNLWRQYLTLDLDLSSVTDSCYLTFHQRYDAEYEQPESGFDAWDGMNVRISTDGGATWEVLEPEGGYPYHSIYAFYLQDGDSGMPGYSNYTDWTTGGAPVFDLTPYIGQNVKIRWWVASDMYWSTEDGGGFYGAWFIDDILVASGTDTIFFDDAEGDQLPEWSPEGFPAFITGNFWQVIDSLHQPQPDGKPVYYSGPNSAYCGDTASSRGDGSYTPGDHADHGLQCAIVSPSIDLSSVSMATLNFMERGKGDGQGGYAYIDVSTDGGQSWVEMDMRAFSPVASDWSTYSLNLVTASGYNDVKIRFRGGSGTASNHFIYWYIDDVVVTGSGSECISQNDDDNATSYWGDMSQGEMGAARLTNCESSTNGVLKKVSFYIYNPSGGTQSTDFAIHIFTDNQGNVGDEMIPPETVSVQTSNQILWIHHEMEHPSYFAQNQPLWVAIEMLSESPSLFLLMDNDAPAGRNKIFDGSSWGDPPGTFGDFMIRATFDTTSHPNVYEGNTSRGTSISLKVRPNPTILGKTSIDFAIHEDSPVKLVLYNAAGQKVLTLIDRMMKAGSYQIDFDSHGKNLPSGVYFLDLKVKNGSLVRKLTILK